MAHSNECAILFIIRMNHENFVKEIGMRHIYINIYLSCFFFVSVSASVDQTEVTPNRLSGRARENTRKLTVLVEKKKISKEDNVEMEKLVNGVLSFAQTSTQDSILHVAIKNDHDDVAKSLISRGFPLNILDSEKRTPLQRAIIKGKKTLVEDLLQHKAWIVQGDAMLTNTEEVRKVVEDEIEKMTVARISAMLNSGKAEQMSNTRMWPKKEEGMLKALRKNSEEEVLKLLDVPFDFNSRIHGGRALLHIAVSRGYEKVVMRLLEKKVDVDIKDRNKITPMHLAAGSSNPSEEIVLALLRSGADVNAKDKRGMTSLHKAAMNKNETTKIMTKLLESGCDVNLRDSSEFTPLHRATRSGSISNVKFLLSNGADLMAKDKKGWTPLHCAASLGHEDICKELLGRGARVSSEIVELAKSSKKSDNFVGLFDDKKEVLKV